MKWTCIYLKPGHGLPAGMPWEEYFGHGNILCIWPNFFPVLAMAEILLAMAENVFAMGRSFQSLT